MPTACHKCADSVEEVFSEQLDFQLLQQYLPRTDIVGWTGHVRSGIVQTIPGNGLQVM
jgi:hypothetical protein